MGKKKNPNVVTAAEPAKTVFSVRPPADPQSDFILMLLKSGTSGPFGGGGSMMSAIFAVDGMFPVDTGQHPPTHFRAIRNLPDNRKETVCEFPITANFLLVRTSQVDFSTPEESLKESIDHEKKMRAIEEALLPTEKKDPLLGQASIPGQYI